MRLGNFKENLLFIYIVDMDVEVCVCVCVWEPIQLNALVRKAFVNNAILDVHV